ncbi:MAG: fibronectin type III domain-containing protein [Planctomycetota bacterium]|jgi:hypothetical protein
MRTARILVVAVCLGLLPALARGAWTGSPHDVAVTASNEVLLDASGDGDYGLIVVWGAGGEVHAQRLDPVAQHMWDSAGIAVARTTLAAADISAGCGYGGSDGQFVAWTDSLGADTVSNADAKRIYLMRLLPDATVLALTGSLTFGATTDVAGAGSSFTSEVSPGEFIRLNADGQWVKVASVTSDTALVLAEDYPVTPAGPSGAGSLLRSYKRLTGTLSFGGTVDVTGDRTYFTAEITAGDFIRLDSSPGNWMKVASVTDDENLVLEPSPAPVSGTGASSVSAPVVFKTVMDTPADHDCRNPRVLQSGSGAFIVWENYTLAMDDGTDIAPLIQLAYVSEYGDVWWTAGIGNAHRTKGNIRLFPDGSDGIIIVYDHGTSASAEPRTTRAARMNALGEDVWGGRSPYKIWDRPLNVANVAPDGQGGLWVAARWPLVDVPPITEDPLDPQFNALYHRLVNNGEFVVVNRLLPDGTWAWGSWVKALEWDAQEKRTRTVGVNLVSVPDFGDYTTDQAEPTLVSDGDGGVYLVAEDNRQDATTNASLYGQKITDTGSLLWNEGGADNGGNAGYLTDPAPEYDPYPWQEGCAVRVDNAAAKSDHTVHCGSWIDYQPYFVEDRLFNNMTAVWREGAALRMAELDSVGYGAQSWGATDYLDVAAMGNAAAGGYNLKVIANERFGVYMVWNNDPGGANGNVVAIHANFWTMWSTDLEALGRVTDAVGPGPDIFPPAGPATSFAAVAGPGQVDLSWLLPVAGTKPLGDVYGVRIQRSTEGFPQTHDDGEFIWEGPQTSCVDTEVQSNTTYYYSAFAYDTELIWPNYSAPAFASVKVGFADVENLIAVGEDAAVRLSWDPPQGEGSMGVVILRSDGSAPPTRNDRILLLEDTDPLNDPAGVVWVATLDNATTTYLDDDGGTGLTNGQVYYYTVFAYDDAGDPGVPANQPAYSRGTSVSAMPLPPMTSFTAQGTDGVIDLSWVFPEDPASPGNPHPAVAGVVIRYSDAGPVLTSTDGTELSFFGTGSATTFAHAGLTNGDTYWYAAFATDSAGEPRNYSAPLTASETPVDNVPPGDLVAFSAADDETSGLVVLRWTLPPDPDILGVGILRSEVSTQPDPNAYDPEVYEALIWFTTDDPPPYIDGDAVVGTTYHYWAWVADTSLNLSVNPLYDSATPVANFAPYFTGGTPTVTPSIHSATFFWTASEPVTGEVRYGIDATLFDAGATINYSGLRTWSTLAASGTEPISGLPGGTTYTYTAVITDDEGVTSATATGTFTTADLDSSEDNDAGVGDGMEDVWEQNNGLDDSIDDADLDLDLDGVSNIWEYRFGTDPADPDTDGDGVSDYNELLRGGDPLAPFPHVPPLGETDDGCGASGGTKGAWLLALAAAALAVLRLRRRAILARR